MAEGRSGKGCQHEMSNLGKRRLSCQFHEIMGLDVNIESYLLRIYDLYVMAQSWLSPTPLQIQRKLDST